MPNLQKEMAVATATVPLNFQSTMARDKHPSRVGMWRSASPVLGSLPVESTYHSADSFEAFALCHLVLILDHKGQCWQKNPPCP